MPDENGNFSNLHLSMIIPSTQTIGFSTYYTKYSQGGADIPSSVAWSKLNEWNLSLDPYDGLTDIDFQMDGKEKVTWIWQDLKTEMNISVYGLNY